ncbi:SulP family inorganic anion transporter [Aeoliella sp.]|uniref:SulP family inorganic anion transporter n=1 Tax=Aeoliella sp. TaxID=2795800 RepID=UPI003CCC441C
MEKLIEGLRHFQNHVLWERREQFERSAHGQKPQALLITCSDSRVLPETLMQADPGDLFVSRNAGNLVPPCEGPTGEAATIEYAVSALNVTDIIVCGHYRCGAVRAILYPEEAVGLCKTSEWLARAAETGETIRREHPGVEGDALWDKAVERNVLLQVENLTKHPAVAAALAGGTIRLHAWVLRFETGDVLAYEHSSNTFAPLAETLIVHADRSDANSSSRVLEDLGSLKASRVAARPKWFEVLKSDIPSSLVVFMVALPLCLAIAKACGVPAEAGLITGIVGGILVGLITGSPLQVSGPAAGLIVILLDIIQRQGIGMLGVVVLLAGLIQVAAALLRLGQWFRAVSPAVILGMLAGIGAVIFSQQFHVALDDAPAKNPLINLVNIPQAVAHVFVGHDGHPGHLPAALVGAATLLILVFWRRVVPIKLAAIPAVIVAITAVTAVAAYLSLPIERVEFDSLGAAVNWIDIGSLPALLASPSVWKVALTVAFITSAQTLLTAAAVDRMHQGPRTRYDRELAAQGVGNAVCGLMGALPMAGVIVRSSANVDAGARTRWSTVFHGAWLLVFALLFPEILRMLPTSALAAILVLTGVKLLGVRAIRALWEESRSEGIICVITAGAVVSLDLLTGVLIGIGLSIAKLIYTFSRLSIVPRGDMNGDRRTLVLEGSATFLRLPKLAAALEQVPPSTNLHIELKGLSYIDHACLQLLMDWEQQHESTGGALILDWDTLHARFRSARPRPPQSYTFRQTENSTGGDAFESSRAA